MPKLSYEFLPSVTKPPRYVISFKAYNRQNDVFGYPNITVYCDENKLIEILPKLNAFLANVDESHFDIPDLCYFVKNLDPISSEYVQQYNLLYDIHSIKYINDAGDYFNVKTFEKYL